MVGHESEVVCGTRLHRGSPGSISGIRDGYVDGGGMKSGGEVIRRTLGDREPHVASGFHPTHLVFALFYIVLGLVIHVQAGKGHDDTDCLDGVNWLGKPEDGDADDGDAFDEGSDRVGDRGRGRED